MDCKICGKKIGKPNNKQICKECQEHRFCKRCGNKLTSFKKSEYCRHCYIYIDHKKLRENRVKNHLCVLCGKPSEKIVLYHNNGKKEIKYPYRCLKCNKKIRKYRQKKKSYLMNGGLELNQEILDKS